MKSLRELALTSRSSHSGLLRWSWGLPACRSRLFRSCRSTIRSALSARHKFLLFVFFVVFVVFVELTDDQLSCKVDASHIPDTHQRLRLFTSSGGRLSWRSGLHRWRACLALASALLAPGGTTHGHIRFFDLVREIIIIHYKARERFQSIPAHRSLFCTYTCFRHSALFVYGLSTIARRRQFGS